MRTLIHTDTHKLCLTVTHKYPHKHSHTLSHTKSLVLLFSLCLTRTLITHTVTRIHINTNTFLVTQICIRITQNGNQINLAIISQISNHIIRITRIIHRVLNPSIGNQWMSTPVHSQCYQFEILFSSNSVVQIQQQRGTRARNSSIRKLLEWSPQLV